MLGTVVRRAGGLGLGTALGQGAILAATPILARIYGPAPFGALALLITISNIAIAAGCARYDLAIPTSRDGELPALARFALCVAVATSIVTAAVLAVMARGAVFGDYFDRIQIDPWLAGSCFLFAATYQAAGSCLLQKNQIAQLSALRAFQGILFVGFALVPEVGLLWALTLSYAPGLLMLLWFASRKVGDASIRSIAAKYRRFAIFGLPGTMLDVIGYSLCIWVVLATYGVEQGGQMSQVQRLIGAPMMLVSISLGQIILKQAADMRDDTDALVKLIRQLLILMTVGGLVTLVALRIVGDQVIDLVFGDEWGISREFLLTLAVAIMIRAIVSPVSVLFVAFDRLDLSLRWQVLYFISAATLFSTLASILGFMSFIRYYALHECVLYLVYLAMIWSLLRKLQCAASSVK